MISALQKGEQSFFRLVARTAAADTAVQPVPQGILDWLARLFVLEGVPFEYLVPNPAMLPQESFRFFLIDSNWLYRAVEGAVSAGVSSSRDVIATLSAVEDQLRARVPASALTLRSRDRGLPLVASASSAPAVPWSGFLLRSIAVSGWPGIEVSASDADGNPLKIIRVDRLSPSVLFCLFQGVAKHIRVMEPPETLHFGVFMEKSDQRYVYLRNIGWKGSTPGAQVDPKEKQQVVFRASSAYPGVVRTAATAAALQEELAGRFAEKNFKITSAEYAIQMVKAAGLQPFVQEDQ